MPQFATGQGVVNLSLGSQIQEPASGHMIAVTSGHGYARRRCGREQPRTGQPARIPGKPPACRHGRRDRPAGACRPSSRAGRRYVDLAAPGGTSPWQCRRRSTRRTSYDFFSGTSFASPIVAGAAAWVWTVRPNAGHHAGLRSHARSAQDISDPGFDPFSGFGRLDIPTALVVPAPAADPQEPNEDVTYVKAGGLLHRASDPAATAGRLAARRSAARLRRGSARRLPRLGAGPAHRGRRAPALRRGRRPRALGAAHGSVLEAGATLDARLQGHLGADRNQARALRVKNSTPHGAYYYIEASVGAGSGTVVAATSPGSATASRLARQEEEPLDGSGGVVRRDTGGLRLADAHADALDLGTARRARRRRRPQAPRAARTCRPSETSRTQSATSR